MINTKSRPLTNIFQAIANQTRREILHRLAASPCVVAELVRHFDVSAPAISRHLSVLERAGLVVRSRTGKSQQIRLSRESLGPAIRFMAELGAGDGGGSVSTKVARAAETPTEINDDPEDDEWTKLL